MPAESASWNLGKLFRMHGMVSRAALMETASQAGGALARAYLGLRDEMLLSLDTEELTPLREEFERLFPVMEVPEPHDPHWDVQRSGTRLMEAAMEAQLHLRRLEGWIQGLIDEMTLEQRLRLRMDAEEKAKAERKLKPGFGGT
jgi:LmbE family N-acetylglucosaminyl deacetylase